MERQRPNIEYENLTPVDVLENAVQQTEAIYGVANMLEITYQQGGKNVDLIHALHVENATIIAGLPGSITSTKKPFSPDAMGRLELLSQQARTLLTGNATNSQLSGLLVEMQPSPGQSQFVLRNILQSVNLPRK